MEDGHSLTIRFHHDPEPSCDKTQSGNSSHNTNDTSISHPSAYASDAMATSELKNPMLSPNATSEIRFDNRINVPGMSANGVIVTFQCSVGTETSTWTDLGNQSNKRSQKILRFEAFDRDCIPAEVPIVEEEVEAINKFLQSSWPSLVDRSISHPKALDWSKDSQSSLYCVKEPGRDYRVKKSTLLDLLEKREGEKTKREGEWLDARSASVARTLSRFFRDLYLFSYYEYDRPLGIDDVSQCLGTQMALLASEIVEFEQEAANAEQELAVIAQEISERCE